MAAGTVVVGPNQLKHCPFEIYPGDALLLTHRIRTDECPVTFGTRPGVRDQDPHPRNAGDAVGVMANGSLGNTQIARRDVAAPERQVGRGWAHDLPVEPNTVQPKPAAR